MGPQAIQPLILVVDHDRRSDNPLLSTLASHGFRTLHASARPGGIWGPSAAAPIWCCSTCAHGATTSQAS